MTPDPFTQRLIRVRSRFAATLAGKIEAASGTMAHAANIDSDAAAAVDEVYRLVHGIVGVGAAVGFVATGRAANDVEGVLRSARTARRRLTDDEMGLLAETLQVLREAAAHELQLFDSPQQ